MSLLYDLSLNEGKGSVTKERIRGNLLPIEYVFNHARYKESCSPRWVTSALEGYALDFDGYSTYIKDESIEVNGSLTIVTLIAPRCFEACHGEVSTTIIDQLDKAGKKGFALSLYQHGEVQFEIGNGNRIDTFRSNEQLELFKKSFITVTFNHETNWISIYINSKRVMCELIDGFENADIPLSIGLNNTPFEISDIFKGGMFSGLVDFIRIYDEAWLSEKIQNNFICIKDKLSLDFQDIDLDENKLLDDIHRPQYHAIPPQHWMNEPHAPFYYKGKYHLFYQKNATGPYFSNLHWGHWTSDDLVFWKNEKTALFPQRGELTPSGVWSGSAAIGPKSIPYLFYTSANLAKDYNQGVAIARPKNLDDIHLVDWEMDDQSTITQTDKQGMPSQFRDPFVWKDDKEEIWYLIIGGGMEDKGPTAWIYASTDCENWQFKGDFFTVDSEDFPYLGTNWELPVLLPVSDDKGNTKYVFLFMSYFNKEEKYQVDTYFYLGQFDKENLRFIPDSLEPQLLDYGKFKFSGPSGFVDPVTNKSIVFSILQGNRNEQEEYESGWAHNAGLPIELYLENNELRMKPIENLVALRNKVLVNERDKPLVQINEKLKEISGKMLEVIVEFDHTEKLVGFECKKDPKNQEKTSLLYEKEKKQVWIDRSKSFLGREGDIQGGILDIDEGFSAHIYIDHSAIECYLNNKKMISSRAYPTLKNSDDISLIGEKDIIIKSMKVFELKSIWKKED
ncbi:GH32 C-terminal domain-containing protein [Metabacillus sediminilitoris]|uniref:beta-fructofuranosidase n=1 Tax=Metabacillus sediminilitoris TaxID=2567941 RepID=A0A4S4BQU5_9BACI|nr:GH32 C-terminal domain-containing protein [Metabacillus sediminilitoris]QGQ45716.1 glycoside hydrolase [Metabacillus sediminilitoris]THF77168.1 glycoside hydrolase [Metabacillus sediminilitoris]